MSDRDIDRETERELTSCSEPVPTIPDPTYLGPPSRAACDSVTIVTIVILPVCVQKRKKLV